MRVTNEKLEELQACVFLKDRAAYALGVAWAEFELEKMRLMEDKGVLPQEQMFKLGALVHEIDGYRATHMRVVVQANHRQLVLGETALKECGLPQERNFTIDTKTGEVFELLHGEYIPVVK